MALILSVFALLISLVALFFSFLSLDMKHWDRLYKRISELKEMLIHKLKYSFSVGYRRWTKTWLNHRSKRYYKR